MASHYTRIVRTVSSGRNKHNWHFTCSCGRSGRAMSTPYQAELMATKHARQKR